MCIICLEFQKHRDIADARHMLGRARLEPNDIDKSHLDAVEAALDTVEAETQSSDNATDSSQS